MAFDGITVAGLIDELKRTIQGGKISKIAQPETDELLFTIKNNKETYRLLISASASLPFIYLTDSNKQSPLTAPNFCMLLRKHIGSGRIINITQPGLERIVCFEIEHLDELGDLNTKLLIAEIMGKHSNIIFCKKDKTILDSIKHVSANISSIREVLPGRTYFIPETVKKADPLTVSEAEFIRLIQQAPMPIGKAMVMNLTGISYPVSEEICHLAALDSQLPGSSFGPHELVHLSRTFAHLMEDVKGGVFAPNIIYEGDDLPVEFSAIPLTHFQGEAFHCRTYSSISRLLIDYYAARNSLTRIRQKSSDLRKVVQTILERNYKKYDLQLKQLKDTEKKEKYRIYGELLNTYGYALTGGEKEFTADNYYTSQPITIPLDDKLTAQENAQKYFDRYNKLKRTYEALSTLVKDTEKEISHLESISTALDIAAQESDLVEIKEELMEYGFLKKRHPGAKKPKITSKPFHYLSSDGFHLYVGKNNYQNEQLTFKMAEGNDWWFHAKNMPGSHVILKAEGREDLPDRVFEEAGALAAYYSKGRDSEKVEVDYIQRKHVKRVAGAAPGFVIYHTNYSLIAEPKLVLEEVK